MTELEKKQPLNSFIETGRKAYRMAVHISGNPHIKQPYRDLWDKGWRMARRQEEGIAERPEGKRQFPSRNPKADGADRKQRFQKRIEYAADQTPRRDFRAKPVDKRPIVVRSEAAKMPEPQRAEQPVLTESLMERFNRRHQTRA